MTFKNEIEKLNYKYEDWVNSVNSSYCRCCLGFSTFCLVWGLSLGATFVFYQIVGSSIEKSLYKGYNP